MACLFTSGKATADMDGNLVESDKFLLTKDKPKQLRMRVKCSKTVTPIFRFDHCTMIWGETEMYRTDTINKAGVLDSVSLENPKFLAELLSRIHHLGCLPCLALCRINSYDFGTR